MGKQNNQKQIAELQKRREMKKLINFIIGMGNIFGIYHKPIKIMSDEEAMYDCWDKVGKDFETVVNW